MHAAIAEEITDFIYMVKVELLYKLRALYRAVINHFIYVHAAALEQHSISALNISN